MGELYCLDVGFGDASVILTGTSTVLVDCHNIEAYSDKLPKDGHIQGIFITHQHEDHYSGLRYFRDNGFTIGILIHSPYERRWNDDSVSSDEWNEFNSLKEYFEKRGTKSYAPFRPNDFKEPFWSLNDVRFEIIGPSRYIAQDGTRELHDACLVIAARLGTRTCLFAGDASDKNLKDLAYTTDNFCNDILHASHHGSINGAELSFIKKCNADYTVISTKSGVKQSVPDSTALKRYRDNTKKNVVRTDNDGTQKLTF